MFNLSSISVGRELVIHKGRTVVHRKVQTPKGMRYRMTKALEAFIFKTKAHAVPFDLFLKGIQASALTFITLVKVPDFPFIPAHIRDFSKMAETAGCMCCFYSFTAGTVWQLSQEPVLLFNPLFILMWKVQKLRSIYYAETNFHFLKMLHTVFLH